MLTKTIGDALDDKGELLLVIAGHLTIELEDQILQLDTGRPPKANFLPVVKSPGRGWSRALVNVSEAYRAA